ncbi:MAG: hypothetical protein KGJ23_09635 [Euryarchaeota archaeon]|nr:hypothetical protein [Euryarchaeota archaeon]MDE1836863.1 hypothetical protein [Euryarchaeota archaeon]MDE1879742.1 hypothetical protein [Euryarchaeota archaeon]MDE2046035.1 hypothetical protein [Thermoplasmata archaeon]
MATSGRARQVLPWVALSMLTEGEGDALRVNALSLVSSDAPKEPKVFVREDAIAHPRMRQAVLNATPPLWQAYALLGGWVVEGRGFVLFDRFNVQLKGLEQEFVRYQLPALSFSAAPVLEIYRSVAAKARARPTVERLIQENIGMVLTRGREGIGAMWLRGDVTGAIEALRQDVVGLVMLVDLGLKRGSVKLDGTPIPVDWDRRLRSAMRATGAAGAGGAA